MENGFSVLMFIFSFALSLYALILAIKKDYNMLPYRATMSVKPKDPKKYTVQFSKVIVMVSTAILLGATVALWNGVVGAVVILVGVIGAIWRGTKIVKNE